MNNFTQSQGGKYQIRQVKWTVSVVMAYGHFKLPLWFVRAGMG